MTQKEKLIKYAENLVVIILWGVIFLAPIIILNEQNGIRWRLVAGIWRAMIPFLILFLVNHYVLIPKLLFRNRPWWYGLSVILLIAFFGLGLQANRAGVPRQISPRAVWSKPANRAIPLRRLPNLQNRLRPNNPVPLLPFYNSLLIAFLVLGFDTGLRTLVKWTRTEQERTLLEKENVKHQLAFLKTQLSPHFFMNTLNNIHAQIDLDQEAAKESLIRLSHLMRHLLYESQQELIPVEKELAFIKAYISLMRMRFPDRVVIDFQVNGVLPERQIPPLLFIAVLENAFKHGVSYHHDSFIRIAVDFGESLLHFTVVNSRHPHVSIEGPSGIGLVNTRRRLDLLYGSSYKWEQQMSENQFLVHLTIPL